MTTTTLTDWQSEILRRVKIRVERDNTPARDALLLELADGAADDDVAAVAEDLCPGSGKDYLR